MRLKSIRATPHPSGNRIDLTWVNPDPDQYPGVRVVRREGTYPTSPEDYLFSLELNFQSDLDNELLSSALRLEFSDNQVSLSDNAIVSIEVPDSKWRILDGEKKYVIRKGENTLNVYDESILVADPFLFSLELNFQSDLDNELLSSALRLEFSDNQVSLSDNAIVSMEVPDSKWRILDGEKKYVIRKSDSALNVYDEGLTSAADKNLRGETVYYYTLFPHKGEPPEYRFDRHNRTAAMATAPHDMAGQMYDLLPGIYHRYDTVLPKPDEVSEEDEQKGQLRRFLDLPGSQLDQLYSFARAMLDLYDIDKVDGRLLPLLAGWIGWETDYRQEIDTQRNEIRSAPYVYQRIGIIPTVEATVKRILGWESRTKEFVHNVFVSNRPERLNIWTCQRGDTGEWSEPTEPLSLDFAYEGRPTAVHDGDDTLWLFYHTLRNDRWDIWYKTLSTFSVALDSDTLEALRSDLDNGLISADLQQVFADAGFSLSQKATVEKKNSEWRITDADNEEIYTVRLAEGQLSAYRWIPSQRLTHRIRIDKHPTTAVQKHPTTNGQAETLWVFWNSYDEADRTWRIEYRYQTRQPGDDWPDDWTDIATFGDPGQPERRRPWAVADDMAGLWLFWLELGKEGARWKLKYNRHNGDKWEFKVPHTFPLDDEGKDPRVESDLFVLFQPADSTPDSTPRLWVFWTRKVPTGPANQTRWQIAYRVATGVEPDGLVWMRSWSPDYPDHRTVDFDAVPIDTHFRTWYDKVPDWSSIYTLPKEAPEDYHDREPAAFVNAERNVELFWSSNQDGGWSIWRRTLLDIVPPSWGSAEQVTAPPYSQRTPLPILVADGTWLIYRSNESLAYVSAVYGATETTDFRYAGSTTLEPCNVAKIALKDQYGDFQTYSYDAGQNGIRTNLDWYARDTVGVYLTPDTEDRTLILRNQNLIEDVLRRFLPIQVRVVFIIEPAVYKELVYTYDFSTAKPQRLIGEQFLDSMESITSEVYTGLTDDYLDNVPGWVWVRAWSEAYPDHRTVDFATIPVDTRFRTWHIGLEAGGSSHGKNGQFNQRHLSRRSHRSGQPGTPRQWLGLQYGCGWMPRPVGGVYKERTLVGWHSVPGRGPGAGNVGYHRSA